MIKMTDVIRDIVMHNPCFQFGLSNRLCNLSQLAKFIHPLVEAKAQKEIQTSAIVMNLSRLQQEITPNTPQPEDFKIENVSIYSNLVTMSFFKNEKIHQDIHQAHQEIIQKNGYFTISESTSEITLITENQHLPTVTKLVHHKPKYQNKNVASISVKFDESYFEVPGLLYLLIQKMTLQNINLIEIASTYTELIFYIENEDVQTAFETIHTCFQSHHEIQ